MTQQQLFPTPPTRQLIGIGHQARVGKDVAASALVRDLGFRRIGFADALKDLAMKVNPIVLAIPGIQNVSIGHNRLAWLVQMEGFERAKERYPEVRKFLQQLGVGIRDVLGEDTWVNHALHVSRNWDKVVIPDVRFSNEIAAIQAAGGKLIKINRPGYGTGDLHVSETELADWDGWDGVLANDGSIVDLEAAVVAWAKQAYRVAT